MDNSNEERNYEMLAESPLMWLEQAELLKMSAEVILVELLKLTNVSQTFPGVREKKLGYVQSFMLLMGLSFENLIKGTLTALTPTSSIEARLKEWKSYNKGHGIAGLAKTITSLNPDEENLLIRLEIYIVWAGRYSIASTVNQYAKSLQPTNLHTFKFTDPTLCDSLFSRLSFILKAEAPK